MLALLDHPERNLPPVVHVAGTNGKGSVLAFLRAMLEAAGKRVHVYTSPHLVRFHERIRLAGTLIDEDALAALLEDCEDVNGGTPITFFEITTVAALLAFARHPADVLLLETGLGGRLDATNVVARPRLTIQMPISFDHMQYLGETLAEIAFEKAGILKAGTPSVVAPQPAEAAAVFDDRARALSVPLYRAGTEWRFSPTADGFDYEGLNGACTFPRPGLPGAFQIENAACAVACAEQLEDLGLGTGATALERITRGIRNVEWPGRLQRLQTGPLVARLPADWELWLDGGHNASAGEALAAAAVKWRDRPLHLVMGMLNTKPLEDFLVPLLPHAHSVHSVTIPGVEATMSADEVAQRAREAGATATASDSVADAVGTIVDTAPGPARILICGSLYLAGRVLADNR